MKRDQLPLRKDTPSRPRPMRVQGRPGDGRAYLLGSLLKRVSRSFYLSMRVLPPSMRDCIGLAYLLARTADTIADKAPGTALERLDLLLGLLSQVQGQGDWATLRRIEVDLAGRRADPTEQALLSSVSQQLALLESLDERERAAVTRVVTTLTRGMEWDLRFFGDEMENRVIAVASSAELDRYTYLVAGCVGEFWTEIALYHHPAMDHVDEDRLAELGVRFGKALQMTNILRDGGQDVASGRCYLPAQLLMPLGVKPGDLLIRGRLPVAWPALVTLLRVTLDHYRAAQEYVLTVPPNCVRMRLACLWPLVFGLETLAALVRHPRWLARPRPLKITRMQVYGVVARSLAVVRSDAGIRRWTDTLFADIEAHLNREPRPATAPAPLDPPLRAPSRSGRADHTDYQPTEPFAERGH